MVAKKVEVLTLKAGEKQGYLWASEGTGDFEISEAPLDKVGTKITLYLKDDEDAEDFASEWKIKDIVQKYSGFVSYGITHRNLPRTTRAKSKKSPKNV
jgi:Molecular chaperone, HSP90 family